MGICYPCGKEVEPPMRCPHCNLTFCADHLPQKAHKCMALSSTLSGIKPQPVKKTIQYVEPEEEEEPYKLRPRDSQS
ncbi:hypothetical protein E4H04_01615 [Candidatus Bathyarchaeota archaeon]|nr:MAG: hypothetical protein E4H04_01615 [Candidatus Bathyarchaeota archaeon]